MENQIRNTSFFWPEYDMAKLHTGDLHRPAEAKTSRGPASEVIVHASDHSSDAVVELDLPDGSAWPGGNGSRNVQHRG
jgi:hypothetical protein